MARQAEALAKERLVELSEARDPESLETYLTAYVDLTDDRRGDVLEARARELRAALEDAGLRENLDEALQQVEDALGDVAAGDARGVAVFASPRHDFLRVQALAEPVDTCLVLDSGPYVRPIVRYHDRHEAFVLVLMDGERAAVYLVDDATVAEERSERARLTSRHGKGGMSQMRFHRKRRGALERFLDDVADDVRGLLREDGARRLLVAGPGQVKRRLLDHLGTEAEGALLAVEDVDLGDASTSELVRRFARVARDEEDETSGWAVDELRAGLLRGELATTGAFPVVRAARDGRAETLVVLEGATAGGRKCERHEALFEAGDVCEACGDEGTEVDLVEEAVEYTVRAEGEVEFTPESEFLRDVGGVGALLRW